MTDLHQFIEHLIEQGLLHLVLFGDIVFAISGALVAARHRMDLFGFVLLGTITGIGGGTMRDLALNRPVFWLSSPVELLLCIGASAARQRKYRERLSLPAVAVGSEPACARPRRVGGCEDRPQAGSHGAESQLEVKRPGISDAMHLQDR